MQRSFSVPAPGRLFLLLVLVVALAWGCSSGSNTLSSLQGPGSPNGTGSGGSSQTGDSGSGGSGQSSGSGSGGSNQTGGTGSSNSGQTGSSGSGNSGQTGGSGSGGPNTGSSWTQLAYPFNDGGKTKVIAMAVAPNGNLYAAGSLGVAASTNGGQTWNFINKGLPNFTIPTLGFNSLGEPMASVGTNPAAVYRYTQGSWHLATGVTANLKISAFTLDNTGALIAVTAWYGDVWRSTNNGASFVKVASAVGSTNGSSAGALWSVFSAPDGSLYTGGELKTGIYRSTNHGTTWVQDGLSSTQGFIGNIFAINTNALGEVLASRTSSSGGVVLQRRTSKGWVSSSSGLPTYNTVQGLALAPSHAILISLTSNGTTGGVYRSTDNGQTWTNYSTGLPNNLVGPLGIDKNGMAYVVIRPFQDSTSFKGPFSIYKRQVP